MRWIKRILILIAVALLFWWTLPKEPPSNWNLAQVIAIKDGDSFVVSQAGNSIELRLIGIDAPEYGQPWSQEAREELVRTIPDGTFIYYTEEKLLPDAFGRKLVVVYTEVDQPFEESINARLVRLGLAIVPDYPDPTIYYPELKRLEKEAKEKSLGIHGDS